MEQSNSLDKVWHYPEPLDSQIESSMPYPVEALPSSIQNLVLSYQGYGKQPISLIASTALANLSLSCQALANVARDEFLMSPVSLYLIAIAHSGERKSAADSLFSRPVRQWEQTIRQKCEPMLLSALTEHKTWQMERDGLLSKIRRAAFSENDTNGEHYKDLLNRLMQEEPMIPVQPSLYFEDVTAEALSLHLRENWPSAALWSDEAGIIIGSHGMQASPTRFVALLNRLWEDKAFTTHRKTSRSFVLENRRLTLSLMMQPVLFEKLLAHPLNIHRQSGFLARCLLCFPESSIGTRFYEEPVGSLEGQEIYEKRITECLNEAAHLDERGCVNLKMLHLSKSAKSLWVQFFNQIETGLKPSGQWTELKDFASKASENAARLAALFHLFKGRDGEIQCDDMESATCIIKWHLNETRRLFAPLAAETNNYDAMVLLKWIKEQKKKIISLGEVLQFSPVRDKKRRDLSLQTLEDNHYLRLVKNKRKTLIQVNPWI